ncbi:MAG: hypothetical protein RR601_05285 [Erysipelotrichales bacterium]
MKSKKYIYIIITVIILGIGSFTFYNLFQKQNTVALNKEIKTFKLSDVDYNVIQDNSYLNDEELNSYNAIFDNLEKEGINKEELKSLLDSLFNLYDSAIFNIDKNLEVIVNDQIGRINKIEAKSNNVKKIKQELIKKRKSYKITIDRDKNNYENLKVALEEIKVKKSDTKDIEDLEKLIGK